MAIAMPGWLRWYKKPSQVDLKAYTYALNRIYEARESGPESSRNSVSSSRSELSIPKDLTLDRILSNATCSPMSLYDFYMYLRHVEFSQENLEFYLWYQDYQHRYSKIPKPRTKEVGTQTHDLPMKQAEKTSTKHEISVNESEICTLVDSNTTREFINYVESLVLYKTSQYPRPCCTMPTEKDDICGPPSLKEQNQYECQQIIALFLTPGSSKELNIPPSMRKAIITKLSVSDSPDIFLRVSQHIYQLLKDCSHRNFVRLGVNNGTFETLCMVTFIGILFTFLGFFIMFLLAFTSPEIHKSSRWRALASIPFWFIGISFLLAGLRGSCFLLLLFSRRQELPWERIDNNDDENSIRTNISSCRSNTNRSKKGLKKFTKKLMIFEKKIRVRDIGLRMLQRKIVVQSVIGAVIGTVILEVVFLCLPVWMPL